MWSREREREVTVGRRVEGTPEALFSMPTS
jgi:hypothetical protein